MNLLLVTKRLHAFLFSGMCQKSNQGWLFDTYRELVLSHGVKAVLDERKPHAPRNVRRDLVGPNEKAAEKHGKNDKLRKGGGC